MWNLSKQDRILSWKAFRESLDSLSLEECIKTVNKHWWTAPVSSQFYCQSLTENWPKPWELVVENYYDDIGRALGMLYTIQLSNHTCDVKLLCGVDDGDEYNLVLIDDEKYTLNWDTNFYVNTSLSKSLKNIRIFNAEDLINW